VISLVNPAPSYPILVLRSATQLAATSVSVLVVFPLPASPPPLDEISYVHICVFSKAMVLPSPSRYGCLKFPAHFLKGPPPLDPPPRIARHLHDRIVVLCFQRSHPYPPLQTNCFLFPPFVLPPYSFFPQLFFLCPVIGF